MLELFPEGFEEREGESLELAAYTDGAGEELVMHAFGSASSVDIAPDWAERWRDFHRPVRIGPLWVGPPWERPPSDAIPVVIDPGRAFGTGAHATTRLCLELLTGLQPGSLLDVGCGSGVIAVAAVKLGFGPVVALDRDEPAVEAARINASRNNAEIDVRLDDLATAVLPRADVTVANVTLEAVETLGRRVDSERLVTAGYLVHDEPRLDGYALEDRRAADGWTADLYRRVGGARPG
jgi:ribosomal protein L11 methyltransferase